MDAVTFTGSVQPLSIEQLGFDCLTIPDQVILAVNFLLEASVPVEGVWRVTREEIFQEAKYIGIPESELYKNVHWMHFEWMYREKGWSCIYDGNGTYLFRKRDPNRGF